VFNNFFAQKFVPFMWKKYCREGEAKNDNITGRMRFAYWINKATNKNTHTHTNTEYIFLIFMDPCIVV